MIKFLLLTLLVLSAVKAIQLPELVASVDDDNKLLFARADAGINNDLKIDPTQFLHKLMLFQKAGIADVQADLGPIRPHKSTFRPWRTTPHRGLTTFYPSRASRRPRSTHGPRQI
jgi:hypothetical protein